MTCAATLVGCANPEGVASLDAPDSAARMRAIRAAGASNNRSAVPALIERLESDDPAERLLAIRTLERLTGETHGFDFASPKPERDAAIERWTSWLVGSNSPAAKTAARSEVVP